MGKRSSLIKHESAENSNLEDEVKRSFYSDNTISRISDTSNNAPSYAQKKVDQSLRKSISLSKHMIQRLPTFHFEELTLDKILGYGSFCEVYEVYSMKVLHKSQDGYKIARRSLIEEEMCSDTDSIASLNSFEEKQFHYEKSFIAKNCIRRSTGDARFAIKFLSPDVVQDKSMCVIGAADLATEVMILTNLSHPNIIQIRGISAADFDQIGSVQGYFLILDRLYDTVEQKLPKWKKELPKWSLFTKETQRIKLAQRLVAAYDLASALQYVHDRNIIYRDLKAQNAGFDARGVIKLFDFGLSRELKKQDKTEDGNYKLTGNTGTRRYMAPEVALSKSYNLSADVYSFGILFWEICALERPFKNYSYEDHTERVILGKKRPSMKKFWPSSIKSVLKSMWSNQPSERPNFDFIMCVIEETISKYVAKSEHMTCHRKSSFLRLSDNAY